MKNLHKAFTLIELLIVVAIIAILAAIAVPNFLEAQTRSKVSAAKSNMRTMATGIESFFVDNNRYPAVRHEEALSSIQDGMWSLEQVRPGALFESLGYPVHATLTTPIAYVSGYIEDPFTTMNSDPNLRGWQYGVGEGWKGGWALESVGPDQDLGAVESRADAQFADVLDAPYAGMILGERDSLDNGSLEKSFYGMLEAGGNDRGAINELFVLGSYDPTNGTRSEGDIVRLGP